MNNISTDIKKNGNPILRENCFVKSSVDSKYFFNLVWRILDFLSGTGLDFGSTKGSRKKKYFFNGRAI